MDKNKKSKIQFILSMIIFGTIALFVKNINISSGELALYRAVLASCVIAIILIVRRQKLSFATNKKEMTLIVVSGFAMGLNWIFLFEAYKYTTISVATLTYYFAPIIVTIFCPILFKEKLTVKQWICFLMSTLGVVLVIDVGGANIGNNNFIGGLLGITAAVFYATVIILNKCVRSIDGINRTLIQFISAIFVLLIYVLFTSGFNIVGLDSVSWVNILIVGIFHTGITYCLYFSSLKDLSGQNVAILSYIDPFIAILISFLIGEKMTVLQMIGGILIIIFTLINEISFKKNIKRFRKFSNEKK